MSGYAFASLVERLQAGRAREDIAHTFAARPAPRAATTSGAVRRPGPAAAPGAGGVPPVPPRTPARAVDLASVAARLDLIAGRRRTA